MTVYVSWIYLNIPKYPWKFLNKLFWIWKGKKNAWSSYMSDRVLNMSGFCMWHDCNKGYTEFWISLNMAQYASIMPEYAWIALMSLNMSEYDSILLNLP